GIWPLAVSGWDPHTQADKFAPFMALKNVTPDYPPTLLIHGDKDTDVPHEQSQLMDVELTKHKVEHRLITIAGPQHGLPDADPDLVKATYRTAAEFLRQHLAAP